MTEEEKIDLRKIALATAVEIKAGYITHKAAIEEAQKIYKWLLSGNMESLEVNKPVERIG